MANNTDKEKWINDALDSTRGMHRAGPKAGLYDRVMAVDTTRSLVKVIPFPVKQWAAAAILLLALNIGSVVYYNQRKTATRNNQNPFAAALQMETTYDY